MTSWRDASPQICCARILIIVYRHTLPLFVVSRLPVVPSPHDLSILVLYRPVSSCVAALVGGARTATG